MDNIGINSFQKNSLYDHLMSTIDKSENINKITNNTNKPIDNAIKAERFFAIRKYGDPTLQINKTNEKNFTFTKISPEQITPEILMRF